MTNWKKNLKNYIESAEKSKIQLRHNFERIFISSLASQIYCENKLDLDIKYEPESTETQVIGSKIHETVVPLEEDSIDNIITLIESGNEVLSVFPVFFYLKEVLISGITDGILFRNKKPVFLFEIKTTNSTIDKIWPGEMFQAQLYSYALEFMGFDVSDLIIVIPKIKQEIEKESLIFKIIDQIDDKKKNRTIKIPNYPIKIHLFKYKQLSKLEFDLTMNKLIPYWTEMRYPKNSGNPAKCRPCSYKEECEYYEDGSLKKNV